MSSYKKIMSTELHPRQIDWALLLLRGGMGLMMMLQGFPKFKGALAGDSAWFPSVFGLGAPLTLVLAAFAEFILPFLLVLGWYTRFALFLMLVETSIAAFMIYGGEPLTQRENTIFYLIAYAALILTGPGKYSLDGFNKWNR
jgi:putative oxidoreductase